MSNWVHVGIAALIAACSSRTVGERERALERIPAQAQLIFAADGNALATSTFRRVVDSLTSHVPPSMACVAEAAITSEAIAVGVQLETGGVIVLVTRAVVDRCPALSRVAEHTYIATIGAGAVATDRAKSVMADAAWERGRPYLVREPVALAAELPELRLVAVAQPEPLDAWLVVDAVDTSAIEQRLAKGLMRVRDAAAYELAGKLVMKRNGTQVSVRVNGGLTEEDLATLAGHIVRELEMASPMPGPDAVFTCAAPGNGVVSCHDNVVYKVSSVETIVRELGAIDAAPVVSGGDIIGIRLLGDPPRLLRRDDIILGVDSHRITTARQLSELAPHLGGKASIAVRRAGVEAVLDLSE